VHRESLEKSIPFHHYVALGLGVIVGVGWVVYSGQWLQDGGPAGAILAFLIGGLILIPVGMCYAEMTSALPLAGGELSFSYKAFGALPAFLTAWLLALSYVSITPFETIAIGSMFEALLPALASEPLYLVSIGEQQERVAASTLLPGLTTGLFLLWENWHGARDSARIQMAIVVALLLCTAVFCTVALWRGDVSHLQPLFAAPTGGTVGFAAGVSAVVSVLVVVPFFMAGFDAIPQAAEEAGASMSPRQLGAAILISILCGALFYVVIILAVAISMPWTESAQLPMATSAVFEAAFGLPWAARLVLFTALLGLVSTLNGMYVASSRLLFSLGRGGMLPHWFAEVDPVHHTPRNALLFVGAVSLLGPFVGKIALSPIVSSSSFVFTIALMATCLSAIRLRSSAPDMPRPYRAPSFALYLGALVSLVLLLLMLLPMSPGRLGNLELLLVVGWLILGFGAYLWRRYRQPLSDPERDYLILGVPAAEARS
jgi:amino acid transporter